MRSRSQKGQISPWAGNEGLHGREYVCLEETVSSPPMEGWGKGRSELAGGHSLWLLWLLWGQQVPVKRGTRKRWSAQGKVRTRRTGEARSRVHRTREPSQEGQAWGHSGGPGRTGVETLKV